MIYILLGQQAGHTKYPCFLCLLDSRADEPHYSQQEWPIRYELKPGNVVKALNKEGNAFIHLKNIFPGVSNAKLMAGIFNGPQIRELIKNDNFET